MLLAAKAEANAKMLEGTTPLIAASYLGHLDVVKELIAAGADVNAKQDEGTPLIRLAARPPCCSKLLAAKADVNATRSDGATALDFRPLAMPTPTLCMP